MKDPYLEVTFRRGRPPAARYHLPPEPRSRSCRCRELAPGSIVDFTRSVDPIGIEITDSEDVNVASMNRVLRRLGQRPINSRDLAPLRAA
jgi:hypothetical protein